MAAPPEEEGREREEEEEEETGRGGGREEEEEGRAGREREERRRRGGGEGRSKEEGEGSIGGSEDRREPEHPIKPWAPHEVAMGTLHLTPPGHSINPSPACIPGDTAKLLLHNSLLTRSCLLATSVAT